MRKLEALTGVLERAKKEGALQIRVQLEEHFIVEATLAPELKLPEPKTTPSKEKEEDNLAFYSS